MELVVPVVLWGGVPNHSITSLTLTRSGERLFTGSSTGEICLWEIVHSPRPQVAPRMLLVGHESSIVALGMGATSKNQEEDIPPSKKKITPGTRTRGEPRGNEILVSLSQRAVLKFWSPNDGRAIGECNALAPTYIREAFCMAILPSRIRVAVAGDCPGIFIVDLSSRTVVCTLRVHNDWVTSLHASTVIPDSDPAAVLVSASHEGTINLWPAISENQHENFPVGAICLGNSFAPLSLALNPPKKRTKHPDELNDSMHFSESFSPCSLLLVVCESQLCLHFAGRTAPAATVKPPLGKWGGGCFCDNDRILVWVMCGSCYEYSIHVPPDRNTNYAEDFLILQEVGIHDPTKEPEFPTPSNGQENSKYHRGIANAAYQNGLLLCATAFRELIPKFSSVCTTNKISEWNTTSGCVTLFSRIPTRQKLEVPFQGTLPPTAVGFFDEGWSATEELNSDMSCCCVLDDLLLMIRGHRSGHISTLSLPTDPFPKHIRAHSKAVTCLLAPHPSTTPGNRLLVSGGDDFIVKVWELLSFELLQVFSHHSSPVSNILPLNLLPTSLCDQKHPYINCVITIGIDQCVGIFNLTTLRCQHWFTGHSAPITAIHWKVEQVFLLISCADNSMYIWDLTSGSLDRRVTDPVASDILNNYCLHILEDSRVQHSLPVAEDSGITTHTLTLGSSTIRGAMAGSERSRGAAPVLLLNLNIRVLSHQLENTPSPCSLQLRFPTPSPSLLPSPPPTSSPPVRALRRTHSVVTECTQKPPQEPHPASPRLSARGSSKFRPGNVEHHRHHSFRFPPFSILSYFIPWGMNEGIDAVCRRELFLRPPSTSASLGLLGEGGGKFGLSNNSLSLLLPTASNSNSWKKGTTGPWQTSHLLTAYAGIASTTLITTLLQTASEHKNTYSQLLTLFCTLLPELLPEYVEPALGFLTLFWNDTLDHVQNAARSIFSASVDRLDDSEIEDFVTWWGARLPSVAGHSEVTVSGDDFVVIGSNFRTPESHSYTPSIDVSSIKSSLAVLVLAIIGGERPAALPAQLASRVGRALERVLLEEQAIAPLTSAAVELLGRGYQLWRPLLKKPHKIMQQLILMTVIEKQLGVVKSARHTLLLMAISDPSIFIEVIEPHLFDSRNVDGAMRLLVQHIRKSPKSLAPCLGRLSTLLCRILESSTNSSIVSSAIKAFRTLASALPTVASCSDSMAVGMSPSPLVNLIDIRSGNIFCSCIGHRGSVSAVAFSPSGKGLATYSAADATLRIYTVHISSSLGSFLWKFPASVVGPSSTFSTLTAEQYFEVLPPSSWEVNIFGGELCRLEWPDPKVVILLCPWGESRRFAIV